jgi:hypothetical protein
VLPFNEIGAPQEESYFGDGIIEEMIGALASPSGSVRHLTWVDVPVPRRAEPATQASVQPKMACLSFNPSRAVQPAPGRRSLAELRRRL